MNSSFLTGDKADWKRGLKKLPRMQQGHRNGAHHERLQSRGQAEEALARALPGHRLQWGSSTLCRAALQAPWPPREEASSTFAAPPSAAVKWLSAKSPRGHRWSGGGPLQGASVTGFQREEARQGSICEEKSSQFPELMRYITTLRSRQAG